MSAVISNEIEARRAQINAICARFDVRRLELFGSAASGKFDPARSDLDFVVEFRASERLNAFDQYFGFKEELERLFGRSVDLVTEGAVTNQYFLESINRSRRLLYAA